MSIRIIQADESRRLTWQQKWDLLSPYLLQYGNTCMAYSTLQQGLEYLLVEGTGYVAYASVNRWLRPSVKVALGDPIAPCASWSHVAHAFLETCRPAVFVQVHQPFAAFLSTSEHLKVNQMGIETDLAIPSFDLRGKARAQVRHWLNVARNAGISVEEKPLATVASSDFIRLNRQWIQGRGRKELALLARPLVFHDGSQVRCFVATRAGRILAFATFDPLFADGRTLGFYHNHDRYELDCPHGTTALITLTALEQFRREGCRVLCLGMSPCGGLAKAAFDHNPLTAWLLRFMFRHCNFIYNFQGGFFHKSRYAGNVSPVYFAGTRGTTLGDILAVMQASNAL